MQRRSAVTVYFLSYCCLLSHSSEFSMDHADDGAAGYGFSPRRYVCNPAANEFWRRDSFREQGILAEGRSVTGIAGK